MRLQLIVKRHKLPDTPILWSIDELGNPTISQILTLLNETIPLEGINGEYGLEDYVVEVKGKSANFECLHFQFVKDVLVKDDEVIVRPLMSVELKQRKDAGRRKITEDGRHLFDGEAFGRPKRKVASLEETESDTYAERFSKRIRLAGAIEDEDMDKDGEDDHYVEDDEGSDASSESSNYSDSWLDSFGLKEAYVDPMKTRLRRRMRKIQKKIERVRGWVNHYEDTEADDGDINRELLREVTLVTGIRMFRLRDSPDAADDKLSRWFTKAPRIIIDKGGPELTWEQIVMALRKVVKPTTPYVDLFEDEFEGLPCAKKPRGALIKGINWAREDAIHRLALGAENLQHVLIISAWEPETMEELTHPAVMELAKVFPGVERNQIQILLRRLSVAEAYKSLELCADEDNPPLKTWAEFVDTAFREGIDVPLADGKLKFFLDAEDKSQEEHSADTSESQVVVSQLHKTFPQAPALLIGKLAGTLEPRDAYDALAVAHKPVCGKSAFLAVLSVVSSNKPVDREKPKAASAKVTNDDDVPEGDEDEDGSGSEAEEDDDEKAYYDQHGLPPGTIDASGKGSSKKIKFDDAEDQIPQQISKPTLKQSQSRRESTASNKSVRFADTSPKRRVTRSTVPAIDIASDSDDEDFEEPSSSSEADSTDEDSDDSAMEEVGGQKALIRDGYIVPSDINSSSASSSSDSESDSDNDSSSGGGSSSSDNSSDSSSSESDSDGEPEVLSSKVPSIKPIPAPVLPQVQEKAQPTVPPGEGRKATKARNARRRKHNVLQRLQNKGILPAGVTLTEFAKLDGVDDQSTPEAAAEALAELRANHESELSSAQSKKQTAAKKKAEFEERRKALLESLASGGVAVDPEPAALAPAAEKAVRATDDAPASAGKRKTKLDMGAAGRMIFGSLGQKAPKDPKAVADQLRAKAAEVPKLVEEQPFTLDKTAVAAEDDDSWRDKINYTAVECVQEGLELSEPPFPFKQRWDPQQQFTSNAGRGKRKKKRRNQQQYEEEEHYEEEPQGQAANDTPDEIEHNYDDDVMDSVMEQEEVHDQIMRDAEQAQGEEEAVSDLRLPPADPTTLQVVTDFESLAPGTVVCYKTLEMSAETNWQPQMSGWLTAVVIDVLKDQQALDVTVAVRDRRSKQHMYDYETGERIYDKFEMPVDEDEGEEEDDGARVIGYNEFADIRNFYGPPDELLESEDDQDGEDVAMDDVQQTVDTPADDSADQYSAETSAAMTNDEEATAGFSPLQQSKAASEEPQTLENAQAEVEKALQDALMPHAPADNSAIATFKKVIETTTVEATVLQSGTEAAIHKDSVAKSVVDHLDASTPVATDVEALAPSAATSFSPSQFRDAGERQPDATTPNIASLFGTDGANDSQDFLFGPGGDDEDKHIMPSDIQARTRPMFDWADDGQLAAGIAASLEAAKQVALEKERERSTLNEVLQATAAEKLPAPSLPELSNAEKDADAAHASSDVLELVTVASGRRTSQRVSRSLTKKNHLSRLSGLEYEEAMRRLDEEIENGSDVDQPAVVPGTQGAEVSNTGAKASEQTRKDKEKEKESQPDPSESNQSLPPPLSGTKFVSLKERLAAARKARLEERAKDAKKISARRTKSMGAAGNDPSSASTPVASSSRPTFPVLSEEPSPSPQLETKPDAADAEALEESRAADREGRRKKRASLPNLNSSPFKVPAGSQQIDLTLSEDEDALTAGEPVDVRFANDDADEGNGNSAPNAPSSSRAKTKSGVRKTRKRGGSGYGN